MMFEIVDRDGLARICKFKVKGKTLETPTIFAVYNPNIPTITPKDIAKVGLPIITSAYILWKTKRDEVLKKGIHGLLKSENVIMTDSGAFQAFQYGDVELTNQAVVEFQKKIGTDIGVILDRIVGMEEDKTKAREMVRDTIRRAEELFDIGKGDVLWAAPIQGGMHYDLIRYSAQKLSKMDFDLYCVGSVVPFLESYKFNVVANQVLTAKQYLPPSRPVHLFGAGHPLILAFACLLGIDLFDSAYYALSARRGKYLLQSGQSFDLKSMKEVACNCPICSRFTPKEFSERELALHNLYVIQEELRTIKQAIREERIWELVEQRIKAHPSLLDAYLQLKKYGKFLERFEPLSRRKGVFYLGQESNVRPVFSLATRKAEKINSRKRFVWLHHSIPLELKHTYPFGQTTFPEDLAPKIQEATLNPADVVKKVLEYQFGPEACKLIDASIKIELSKSTGMIRRVYKKDMLIGTMRAHDGFFVPTFEGAKLLHELLPSDRSRVVVDREAEPFVREGKNVFAKFVVDASPNIRIWDEVLVVNEDNKLIACGTACMIREEMLSFERGLAVDVRDYSDRDKPS